jgi:hypothetical protein
MTGPTHPIEVLQVLPALPGFDYGYVRVLVKETGLIKYLTFISDRDTSWPPYEPERISVLPDGNWNVAIVTSGDANNECIIASTEKRRLDGIEKLWHPSRVDCLDLESEIAARIHQFFDTNISGEHCGLGSSQVTVVMEWFPDWVYGPKVETEVHYAIQNLGMGPTFLAHLTENNDRVIGFVREKIDG